VFIFFFVYLNLVNIQNLHLKCISHEKTKSTVEITDRTALLSVQAKNLAVKKQTKMSSFARFVRYYADREPVVVASCAIGAVALSLPLIVIPIRRSLGLPTDQYDGPKLPDFILQKRADGRPYSSKTDA
jgi:hypothetical protein